MEKLMIKKKEDVKQLILYTIFGNMTFVISIVSYAFLDIYMGMNELIANAIAWVFAVLFSYATNKKWVFKAPTPTKTALLIWWKIFYAADRGRNHISIHYYSGIPEHVGKDHSTDRCRSTKLCHKQTAGV